MPQILNSDIHEGLENKEVRDLLATTYANLVKTMDTIQKNRSKKTLCNPFEKLTDYSIENYKIQIQYDTYMLEQWKFRKAIETIMSLQNWHQFDISNESNIVQDPLKEFWMDFIGTKEEYNAFLQNHNLI